MDIFPLTLFAVSGNGVYMMFEKIIAVFIMIPKVSLKGSSAEKVRVLDNHC